MKQGRAVLLLLAACGPASLTVAMHAENNSGQVGVATFTDTQDGLVIDMVLQSENPTIGQLSHVHHGRCGEIGEKYLFMNKTSQLDAGFIESKTTFPTSRLADIGDGGFCLNAHDSRDSSLYVSCGNIN